MKCIKKGGGQYILREKSLAIYFGDSQFINMLTSVHDEINRLTFHIILSLILCPLAKTAYQAIVRIVSFFCPMFRSKR